MIRVQSQINVKRTGYNNFTGLTDYKTKKEFMAELGKFYDEVNKNPELACRLFIINVGGKK